VRHPSIHPIHPSASASRLGLFLNGAIAKSKEVAAEKSLVVINGTGASLGLGSVGCLEMGVVCDDIGSHLKAEWVVLQLGVMEMNDHF
jgi:hypothetical protein